MCTRWWRRSGPGQARDLDLPLVRNLGSVVGQDGGAAGAQPAAKIPLRGVGPEAVGPGANLITYWNFIRNYVQR
jgi:hypothetical protein